MKQETLFGNLDDTDVSITEAAEVLGVSTASIRNWIKTGYLKKAGRGRIQKKTLETFNRDIAGQEKLTARANKSQRDSHNHSLTTSQFEQILRDVSRSPHDLGVDYESALSNAYRNKEGIYYTPNNIVEDLLKSLQVDATGQTFCDPCCGSGNFVMKAIECGFSPGMVFGFDTDQIAVEITKRRVFEKTGHESRNIMIRDFLEFAEESRPSRFDYIYTNPPWGKKLPKPARVHLGSHFGAGKSIDTCSLFFFACLKLLKKDGYLGFLLPESFFNISTFEDARIRALSLNITRMIDYGKPFKGLLTKANGIILQKSSPSSEDLITCDIQKTTFKRARDTFLSNPKSILNFQCSPQVVRTLRHIYSIAHVTLHDQAKWGLGIVTGNNKKFCKKESAHGLIPVYKGSDINRRKLNGPSNFIPKDFSLYQQVAPIDLFLTTEKLIYKFISSDLCFFHDNKQRFFLNSANMLIPNESFPLTGRQLCDMLNSNLLNWVFKSIFNTHKILRSDIESLPIHVHYFRENQTFNEDTYLSYLQVVRQSDGTFAVKE